MVCYKKIDDVFCQCIVKMSKFRNRLVYLYCEIDKATLYGFTQIPCFIDTQNRQHTLKSVK